MKFLSICSSPILNDKFLSSNIDIFKSFFISIYLDENGSAIESNSTKTGAKFSKLGFLRHNRYVRAIF